MASQQLHEEYQLIKTNIEQQNELLSRLMTDYQQAQLKDLEVRHDRCAPPHHHRNVHCSAICHCDLWIWIFIITGTRTHHWRFMFVQLGSLHCQSRLEFSIFGWFPFLIFITRIFSWCRLTEGWFTFHAWCEWSSRLRLTAWMGKVWPLGRAKDDLQPASRQFVLPRGKVWIWICVHKVFSLSSVTLWYG